MGSSLFADILSDVVVVPKPGSIEPILISGDKSIPSLTTSSLTVTSGLINGLPVDRFVTTNTEQVFKSKYPISLPRYCTEFKYRYPVFFSDHIVSSSHIEFGNVDVSNQWDGVDVVKLKNSVMTLSGNQVSISSVANSYYRTCQLGELMHSIRLFKYLI